jgi:RHS repeat-associated protein
LYLPGQEVTSVSGAAATVARYYTAGAGGPMVAMRRSGSNAGTYYIGGDAQGSVSWMVNAATLAVTRTRYYPYGQVRGAANAMPTDHGFVGQIEDDTTGLNYLNARYQDPLTGVFLSVDPLVAKTGEPYIYASGNPSTLSDPSGLESLADLSGDHRSVLAMKALIQAEERGDHETFNKLANLVMKDVRLNWAPVGNFFKGGWSKAKSTLGSVACLSNLQCGAQATLGAALHPIDTLKATGKGLVNADSCGWSKKAECAGAFAWDALTIWATRGASARARASSGATEEGGSVFWSGIDGGDSAAASWAAKNGGTTLEMSLEQRGITLPAFDRTNPASVAAWRQASSEFAEGASGNVVVLQGDAVRTTSVWAEVEFPALTANPNVSSISWLNPETGEGGLLWTR